jgi:nucleoside-diphosphate-sugar epimerase
MRIAITGIAGFIGCNVARVLLSAGHTVFGIDDLSLGWASNVPQAIPLFVGDVSTGETWAQMPDADIIVHLAGASSTPMFSDALKGSFANNVLGFLEVLTQARSRHIRRVIYASTSLIYGNLPVPFGEGEATDCLNFYAASKYCMEQIARVYSGEFGLETIGLRFMSVYGPREDHKRTMANLVSQFIWDIESGRRPIIYGDGTQTRDFTSAWDVARAIQNMVDCHDEIGVSILNVGSGIATSLNELVKTIGRITGKNIAPIHVPVPAGRAYNHHQRASLESIHERLGYKPRISLQAGIREILKFRYALSEHDDVDNEPESATSISRTSEATAR